LAFLFLVLIVSSPKGIWESLAIGLGTFALMSGTVFLLAMIFSGASTDILSYKILVTKKKRNSLKSMVAKFFKTKA